MLTLVIFTRVNFTAWHNLMIGFRNTKIQLFSIYIDSLEAALKTSLASNLEFFVSLCTFVR